MLRAISFDWFWSDCRCFQMGKLYDDWHAVCGNEFKQFLPFLLTSEVIIGRLYLALLRPPQCSMVLPRINLPMFTILLPSACQPPESK